MEEAVKLELFLPKIQSLKSNNLFTFSMKKYLIKISFSLTKITYLNFSPNAHVLKTQIFYQN